MPTELASDSPAARQRAVCDAIGHRPLPMPVGGVNWLRRLERYQLDSANPDIDPIALRDRL